MSQITKVCTKCLKDLPLDHFYRRSRNKVGYDTRCKSCSAPDDKAKSYKANYIKKWREERYKKILEEHGEEFACIGCEKTFIRNGSSTIKKVFCEDCITNLSSKERRSIDGKTRNKKKVKRRPKPKPVKDDSEYPSPRCILNDCYEPGIEKLRGYCIHHYRKA